ncbi:MAG: SusC/RagA family TonB-linked outer membrane protein, partial [Bacteroidales bacterium]
MRKLFTSLCVVSAIGAYAQTREISGQILDRDTKEPLVGATVFIGPNEKGAADYNPQGVIADYDGNFTFSLPQSVKHVVVSYLGYEAITLDISKKTRHQIFLAPAVNELQDIVITGYQKIEKRKLTSAITTVAAAEIKQVGVASVDQLLDGQIAGMVSTPANGGPGSPNRIRIRGTASLNGTQDPLWVVDGLPLEGNEVGANFSDKDNIDNLSNTSIAGLNPDDIESITILKDAAATAIYGARAANGVIVVTTKKGKEGKMKINFNAATFITTKPNFDKLNLMNASEKVDFELYLAGRGDLDYRSTMSRGEIARILSANGDKYTFQNSGWDAISSTSQDMINQLRTSGANWFDQTYQTAVNQQYGLSLSGGTEFINYYVSAGYYDEQGTTKGTGFNRFNLTSNLDMKLSNKLNFGIQILGNQSKRTSYLTDTDAFTNPSNYTRSVNPYRTVRNADGSYSYDPDIDSSSDVTPDFNFIEESSNSNYELKNTSLKSIFSLDYKVIRGLKLSTQFGLQIEKSETEKMAQAQTYFSRYYYLKSQYTENGEKKYFLPDGGVIQNWNDDFFQYNWKAQAEFSRTFAEKHDLDVMGGIELRANKSTNIHNKGFGYDHKKLTTKPVNFPSSWTEVPTRFILYRKSYVENAYASYFGTASYTYDNRYTAFGSIRFDG